MAVIIRRSDAFNHSDIYPLLPAGLFLQDDSVAYFEFILALLLARASALQSVTVQAVDWQRRQWTAISIIIFFCSVVLFFSVATFSHITVFRIKKCLQRKLFGAPNNLGKEPFRTPDGAGGTHSQYRHGASYLTVLYRHIITTLFLFHL